MDFKSKLKQEVEKAILKKAAGKILPMDHQDPKMGWKARAITGLTLLAAGIAALLSYLQG